MAGRAALLRGLIDPAAVLDVPREMARLEAPELGGSAAEVAREALLQLRDDARALRQRLDKLIRLPQMKRSWKKSARGSSRGVNGSESRARITCATPMAAPSARRSGR
jgi:hypothetical protein